MQQQSILGYTLEHLIELFLLNGFSKLDAKRIYPWIHRKCVSNFSDMTDIPLNVRTELQNLFSVARPKCINLQKSKDGTQKALLLLDDENSVETVFIPDEKRNTICVSSQIGCCVGCKFCHTGTQKFTRNLTASEIMAQVLFWQDIFETTDNKIYKTITNIVFMGMGEPLFNYQNVAEALNILLDKKTHNFSRNKVTISTSGIIDENFFEIAKIGVKLAVSLHASNNDKRNSLMPINKKYSIEKILAAANRYLEISNTDYVTFEYLLLDKVNDSNEDALELIKLLKHVKCKINLIVFNSWPGCDFLGSDRANQFAKLLISNGLRAIIRASRGGDILAACGQLKTKHDQDSLNKKY